MKELSDIASAMRQEYSRESLNEEDVAAGPMEQFAKWFREAAECEIQNANAFSLATSTPDGRPSLRIVLLKGFDGNGFVFYTNYHSRKGIEISRNPHAAINFFWKELERQVRIEGSLEKISAAESDEYFATRPRGSQLGAWASPQSIPIEKEELDIELEKYTSKFGDTEISRPAHWGGYLLRPDWIEFWQGRPNRLHDRILYTLNNGDWVINRLAP